MTLAVSLVESWSAAMARASWQAGCLAVLVWAICALAPQMPARFQAWLWRIVLLKFAIGLFWAAPIELPLLEAATPVAESSQELPASTFDSVEDTSLELEAAAGIVSRKRLLLFLAWALVVIWQVDRMLNFGVAEASRIRKICQPTADERLLSRLASLCEAFGLRRFPALLEMTGRGSPLVLGLVRPAIVVPLGTLRRLDAAERELVLSHELAHLRRGDLLWNAAAAVLRTVFFFHPLAWICERQLRAQQEIAADELAMTVQRQDPVLYAEVLISIVDKLGSQRHIPMMTLGAAGSFHSLRQRFLAMRHMRPHSGRFVAWYVMAIIVIAAVSLAPWVLVAATSPTIAEQSTTVSPPAVSSQQLRVEKMSQTGRGRFVSFKNGELTLESNSKRHLVWSNIPRDVVGYRYDATIGGFQPVASAVQELEHTQPGTWTQVHVKGGGMSLRIGARQQQTVGTFVSYKDHRLLIIGKNLGEGYTRKYGNQVHFQRFASNVPVYESVDGGEFAAVGFSEDVLGRVREGTIVSVHAEGDSNITLIQLGVPKQR